ncbi:MAG: capping complex subunit for YIEGIA [Peptostreptococcaceae bacterium]
MGNNVGINEYTLAVLTTNKNMCPVGGCPIFYADDDKDLQKKALLMSKCVSGMVHQIEKDTLIIVKH